MSANHTSVITIRTEVDESRRDVQALDSDLNKIGKSSLAAGQSGSAGLSQIERSSKAAAVSQSQLQQIYENVVKTQGANSAAAQKLAAEMNNQAQAADNVARSLEGAAQKLTNVESAANGHAAATGRARDELGRFAGDSDRASESARANAGALNLNTIAAIALTAALARAVERAGAVGIAFDAMKEQALIAFTNLLHSEVQAKALLKDLTDFAAQTPFELSGLIPAAQRLLAMGFTAKELIPTLRAVGDAVAAMGGGAEKVDRVTLALVQMRAKGKVSAEEMMQLAEAGIPAWQILADKIGKTIPEAMKMSEKGAISAGVAIDALVTGMESRFGGMMEQQSRTFNGLMSTLKDTSEQLAGEIAEPIFEATRDQLTRIIAGLPEFQRQFVKFWREIVKEAGNELSQLKPTVAAAIDDVKNLWATRHDEITNITRTAWGLVYLGFIKPMVEGASRLISFSSAAFAGDWEKAMNRLVGSTENAEGRVMGIIGRWVQALFRVSGIISGIGPLLEMASRNQPPPENKFDVSSFHQHKHFEDTADYAERAAKAVGNLNTKHKDGAAAARSMALAENTLARELEEANAALIGDNFASRAAKIDTVIKHEEQAFLISHKQKQLTAADEAQFNAISLARHEKVVQDKFFAERRFQDELRQMEIQAITDGYERERQQTDFRVEKRAEGLIAEFGISKETTGKIIAYRQHQEDIFARWWIDRNVKTYEELTRMGLAFDRQIAADRQKALANPLTGRNVNDTVSQQVKEFEQEQKIISSLIDKFQSRGGGAVQIFDINQLDHAATLMRKYGLTVQDVDNAFGSTSISVEQFTARVDLLTGANLSAIDSLAQMVDWSQVLTSGIHAFTSAIAGAIAGTNDLGKALLASFFQIIGSIAITLGTLFELAAAGFIALPGFQWSAGQLAAAGAALLVFGAVMSGIGQKLAQQDTAQKSSSAGGGASSGGGSGASAPAPRPSQPTIIQVNSTGQPAQPVSQTITIQLHGRSVKDFLKGERVILLDDFRNPMGVVARHIRQIVRSR